MNILLKELWYWVEFGFSWISCQIAVKFFRFQDYLDYLEVMRFQLWHSVGSGSTPGSWSLKVAKYGYNSPQIWVVAPYFTKMRTWFKRFPPIRGIAWDRGMSVNSLEACLVQSEHYLSVEKFSNRTNFQEYILENCPKRLAFHRPRYKDENLSPGLTFWSKLVTGGLSVPWIIYVIVFVLSFFVFVFFEFIYLVFCSAFLKINFFSSISNFLLTPFSKFQKIWFLFFRILIFLLFPIFYSFYVSFVFIFLFLLNFKFLGILFYAFISKYLFKFGFFSYNLYSNGKSFIFNSIITPYWQPQYYGWKIAIVPVRLIFFYFYIRKYVGKRYKFIDICIRFFFKLIRICVVISFAFVIFFYLNLNNLFWWFTNYFVSDIIFFEYDELAGPAYFSILIFFGLSCFFSYVYKFLKIPGSIAISSSISYADRKFVSRSSAKFYKLLSNRPLPRRMKRWKLAREVLALKNMNTEETQGSNIDPSRDLAYKLNHVPNTRDAKLRVIINYLREARQNVFANSILGPASLLESKMSGSDRAYFSFANRDESFKFRPDEFRFLQFHLTKLHYLVSSSSNVSSVMIPRIIFNYRLSSQFPIVTSSKDISAYESSLIFNLNSFNSYFLRITEFSKVSRSRHFFFRTSSRFIPRPVLVTFSDLPLTVVGCLEKLVNAQFFPVWEANCVSTSARWLCAPTKYHERRSFANFQNFFEFDFAPTTSSFQFMFYTHIDRHNRNSFVNTSSYLQFLYDEYWLFKLNTNIFLSRSFGSNFYFSSGFGLPNWLFQNSGFSPVSYPTYQDDVGSLFMHVLGLQSKKFLKTGIFSDIMIKLSKFGNLNYNQYLLDQFLTSLIQQGAGINPNNLSTFPPAFSDWVNHLIFDSVKTDRVAISKLIEHYFLFETRLIDGKTINYMRGLSLDYLQQSFYSTYLHTQTALGLRRYTIGNKERVSGGVWTDLLETARHALFIRRDIDIKAEDEVDELDQARHFVQSQLKQQKLVGYIQNGFRTFPVIRPGFVYYLQALFIAGSYIYALYYPYYSDMRLLLGTFDTNNLPDPDDEFWGIMSDFFVFIIYWLVSLI